MCVRNLNLLFNSLPILRYLSTSLSTILTAVGNSNLTFLTISYRSGDYKDELVWAAAWLYRATNDNTYLTKAESLYNEFGLGNWNGAFNWDNKISGVQVRYLNKFTTYR